MPSPPPRKGQGLIKFLSVIGAGVSLVYLVNPTAGFLELIPDNLPVIGNLDEAGATALLLTCLAQLGLTLPGLKPKNRAKDKDDDGVIDV